MEAMRRVIIDCDTGTDDYLAILILLEAQKSNKIKIEAIVCTAGNTTVENVCTNVVRLLELVKQTHIPVYRGASNSLISTKIEGPRFHGDDGFADLDHETEPDVSIVQRKPAAQALNDLTNEYPNQISLFCIAPLTNVALALRVYDDLPIRDLWVMGGNYTAMGNITATAEFNFYLDPEAVHIVLSTVKQPIFLLTWETCLKSTMSLDWWYETTMSKGKKVWDLLHRADRKLYSQEKYFNPCDAFLAAAMVEPENYIIKSSKHNATIELHGSETRGQLVLDHLKRKSVNINLIEELDSKLMKQLFERLS